MNTSILTDLLGRIPYPLKMSAYRLTRDIRRLLFTGSRHYCPVCNNHLARFFHGSICPVCWSGRRHRFVWLFLQHKTDLFETSPKRMLHIAPEPGIRDRIEQYAQIDYITADIANPFVREKMDITDIKYPADYFDVIYCSHVLEHVPNDTLAMRELQRVLKPNGWAVILVPICKTQSTIENSPVNSPAERKRLFGHRDHVRLYGVDFTDRLTAAGFKVKIISTPDIVEQKDFATMGLTGDQHLFYCTKKA